MDGRQETAHARQERINRRRLTGGSRHETGDVREEMCFSIRSLIDLTAGKNVTNNAQHLKFYTNWDYRGTKHPVLSATLSFREVSLLCAPPAATKRLNEDGWLQYVLDRAGHATIFLFSTTTTRQRKKAFATSDKATNFGLREPRQCVSRQRNSDNYSLATTDSRQ